MIWIHSALCPLFTLSIRVLHSNAGHIQKKSLVMSLFPPTLGHIQKKSFVMSPSPSARGHIDKKLFVMSLFPLTPGHTKQFFLYMSQLYKKEGHNQELFLYMSFNHSPLPSFYLTVSCLTTSSNRFVCCLISSCETP